MFINQEMFYLTDRKTPNSALIIFTIIITFTSFNKLIAFDGIV